MTDADSYRRRMWRGDPLTVAEARRAYRLDPAKGLIPYARALYSFRHKPKCAKGLVELRSELAPYAERYLAHVSAMRGAQRLRMPDGERHALADTADVLSTHLEWISRQPTVPRAGPLSGTRLLALAEGACEEGIRLCLVDSELARGHTYCLLRLTEAMIRMRQKRPLVDEALASAMWGADGLSDPNQKARVCRKVGLILRKRGRSGESLWWGIKACLIPGSTRAVRLKSLAALCGIER